MKYFIQTFGCAQNEADSERIASFYSSRGFTKADSIHTADTIIINTCMIREKAENRVYGLIHNLTQEKKQGRKLSIVVTGCMVGMAAREKSGKMLAGLHRKLPSVDEFLPIEEVGFEHVPLRGHNTHGLVPISNGCNNFCTFCVVPFTRGREISRPFDDIVHEVEKLAHDGYTTITLLGQNVNSYGADLLMGEHNIQVMRDIPGKTYFDASNQKHVISTPEHSRRGEIPLKSAETSTIQVGDRNVKPTYVKHLGRMRIPTLFPALLSTIATIPGIENIDFLSSNPWDFSDDLIATMANHKNISRHIHLPVQSGDSAMLRKMNRWYTREEYLALVRKLKQAIPEITISTDIIVGFCGETDEQFQNTLSLCKEVGFSKVYVAMYSDRPMTAAHKAYQDTVPHPIKKERWTIIEDSINKANLRAGTYR